MQHDPAIIAGVTLAIEAAINEAITLSLGTREALGQKAGISVAVHCSSPEVSVYFFVNDSGSISLQNYSESDTTVSLSGSWRDFQTVAAADDAAGALVNSNITVTGDTAALIEIQQIVSDMDIDWEAPLVASLGHVAGHQLANALRGFWRWRVDSHQRLARQVSEFIIEEGRLSPSKHEIDAFLGDVDDIVLKVDRLESRIKRLQRQLKPASELS